jgi:hypothetical protein
VVTLMARMERDVGCTPKRRKDSAIWEGVSAACARSEQDRRTRSV